MSLEENLLVIPMVMLVEWAAVLFLVNTQAGAKIMVKKVREATFRITYIVSKPCNRAKLCTIHLKILTEISTTNGTKAIALVPFVSCSKYKILIVFSARFIWQFQDTCQQLARQGHWLCERHLRILHPIEWRISDCFGRHEHF